MSFLLRRTTVANLRRAHAAAALESTRCPPSTTPSPRPHRPRRTTCFFCAPPAPNRPYHPHGVEHTYGQVHAEVARLRAHYEAAGFGHGHRVALLLVNRPEFF